MSSPRGRQRVPTLASVVEIGLLTTVANPGCGEELPNESRASRLYLRYCSGSGCHAPIRLQWAGKRYWDREYERMIELIRKQVQPLPPPDEEREIISYLCWHARGFEKE